MKTNSIVIVSFLCLLCMSDCPINFMQQMF